MTIRLAAAEYGNGPVLAILHGLFGSARNWDSIARRLAAHHHVIAFDLRNHGASDWTDGMSYQEMAEDVLAMLDERGYRRTSMLGHSMGGKVAMAAALRDPDMIERLVVVDIAPIGYRAHHLGLVQAMRGLDLSGITRRGEADARLAAAVPDAAERGFLLQNLLFENGRARWRLNLAAIEREMPALAGFPTPEAGAVYPGPALFVAGGRSDYLRPESEPAIRRWFPEAQIRRIENAGHWLHAEQPGAFLAIVEPFLAGEI
ncbi:MAG TPA: alpha/beta fold hydrolase [Stellaceae bacterium]|jgi:pimeloyl-ACP methyl ester carboxylesterase|nr:alpha/beta fold hydrolase [Stellaceae bacterium]